MIASLFGHRGRASALAILWNWAITSKWIALPMVKNGLNNRMSSKIIYLNRSNPFMVAVPQKDRVERMKSLNAAHRSRSNANQSLNVYMLSFDSLSQMSFRRNLPKTVKFIEEEIGSVVLNGE